MSSVDMRLPSLRGRTLQVGTQNDNLLPWDVTLPVGVWSRNPMASSAVLRLQQINPCFDWDATDAPWPKLEGERVFVYKTAHNK